MDRELRILILEDAAADAELMEDELRQAGLLFVSRRVARRHSFLTALEEFAPDIILADYSLPGFGGKEALEIAVKKCPEIPFIFVSGALGEELAIELLKKGATDYVLKDRLAKLPPAVRRALDELTERAERRKFEQALRESEKKYRTVFDNTGTAMIAVKDDGTIVMANHEFEKLTGLAKKEIEHKKSWPDFICADDHNKIAKLKNNSGKLLQDEADNREVRFLGAGGEARDVLVTISPVTDFSNYVISFLDITGRKKAERELKKSENELRQKTLHLEEANTALKVLLKHRQEDQTLIEERVVSNVKKLVLPYVEKLRVLKLSEAQADQLDIIEENLKEIISPFLQNLTVEHYDLTPREIQIAHLVKEGKTTKEIAQLLNISSTAVDFHRKNIRAKLGIKSDKINLRSFLLSMRPQQ